MRNSYEDRHYHRHKPSPWEKLLDIWAFQPGLVIGTACGILAVIVLAVAAAVMLSKEPKPSEEPSEEPEETPWVEPASDEQYDASAGVINLEVFSGTVLPETEDAGWDYVAETLFLGDSNTYRYMLYGHEELDPTTGKKAEVAFTTTANNIGVVSMGAGAIPTLKCEEFKGDSKSYTMPEAVAKLKPQRIIIGFGTNNLSGTGTNAKNFIDTYRKGIAAIVEAWPYADIIVNSIPPLDKQRENTNLSQIQIDAYNEAIVEMCEAEGWKYLNSAEVLKDDQSGWAKKDYTLGDGVHLSKDAVAALFDYIRTHAYLAPDRRPQPLGDIPVPSGVIPNLINKDPIANRNPRYPLEVLVDGGGRASASSNSVKGGSSVTLSATPDEGWKFSYWSCNVGSISGNTLTVPPTCDANGVVVYAHFERDEPEHEHHFVTSVVGPTCTSEGYTLYACEDGDYGYKEDVVPALGHDFADNAQYCRRGCGAANPDYVAPPAHEHSFAQIQNTATCTEPGVITYGCSCGTTKTEESGPLGHAWDGGTIDAEPQPGVAGAGHKTCTRCGATESYTLEALPQVEAPPASEAPAAPEQ